MQHKGVLVLVEASEGGLSSDTANTLPLAAELARGMGHPMSVALLGHEVAPLATELAEQGVPTVYMVDHALLREFQLEVYARTLRRVMEKVAPELVLVPQTEINRALAPYLALSLGGTVVTNCIRLSYDPAEAVLKADCRVMGGAATAVYILEKEPPAIVAIQAQEVERSEEGPRVPGSIVAVDSALDAFSMKTRVVERTVASGPKLEDARIVVAGGRGLGEKEHFRYVEELAEVVGGLPAASRAIVDLGWATPAQQIGLTGKVVSPDLYFAVGISGASQHMAGCSTTGTIVAVNNDPQSPIFKYARYGVVADSVEFLAAFIEACHDILDR